MKPIESALELTNGYINTITRNTVDGWWELEIGLPEAWVFDENTKIGCEVTFENEIGKLIRIFPKKNDVCVDDLVGFVEIVIETNKEIVVREKEFTDKMLSMKNLLEDEAKKFFKELNDLKEHSFKKNNDSFTKSLEKPKKPRKPRTTKTKPSPETEEPEKNEQ